MTKLWVDDWRPAPEAWDQAWTFHDAIYMLERKDYDEVSLDHDLGCFYGYKEMTGMDVLNWLDRRHYESIVIPRIIHVHTSNASVHLAMKQIADRLMGAVKKVPLVR